MIVVTARNQNGGHLEEVKKTPAEVEESLYCASLDAIARGRYKQKITTYVGH